MKAIASKAKKYLVISVLIVIVAIFTLVVTKNPEWLLPSMPTRIIPYK